MIIRTQYECKMQVGGYAKTEQTCVRFVDADGPVGTLTVCIPGEVVGYNEIIVKTWSENDWIHELLRDYPHIFSDTGRFIVGPYDTRAEVWTFDYERAVADGHISGPKESKPS